MIGGAVGASGTGGDGAAAATGAGDSKTIATAIGSEAASGSSRIDTRTTSNAIAA